MAVVNKRTAKVKCAIPNCHNGHATPGIATFRFPRDSERCDQWVLYTGRSDLLLKAPEALNYSYRLCQRHFERKYFMNDRCERLTCRAVPTICHDLVSDSVNSPSKSSVLVRGSSEVEVNEKKSQYTHALSMTRTTADEHIVPGTEVPLISCLPCNDEHKTPLQREQTHQQRSSQPTAAFKRKLEELCLDLSTPPPIKRVRIDSIRKIIITPRKMKLNARILSLRSQLWKLKKVRTNFRNISEPKRLKDKVKDVLKELAKFLPVKTFTFIKTQIKMATVRKNGQRWNMNMKLFALSIFYQSRKAYKLLQSILSLPSHRTLQRTMHNSNIQPGFDDDIFNGLKLKFKSVEILDKHCVLMFDEMSLKTSLLYNKAKDCIDGFEDFGELGRTKVTADHALVFMLRGVSRNWKQPLGYFLVSGSVKPFVLQTLVRKCLSKLDDAGLFVSAIVCDQGPTNCCFLEKLEKISVQQPFLIHNERQVFVLYDPPHLLKNIRNNLKKHGFIYDDQIISWQYVEEFYNFDKSLSIRVAPRLTYKHIELPPFSNMRVNLAAQVLSHSVAAGINTLSILGKLDANAVHTAEFIEKFDQLFNACNSSCIDSSQNMGHAITRNTNHEEFLNSMLGYIASLKLRNSNKYLPCINGWKITITAILMLWKQLQTHNYKFLMTRRLNQDCLENLFSVIRGLGGNRDNPDVHQFKSSFRHILIDKLFAPNLGSNCELDYDQILLDLQNILKPNFPKSCKSDLQDMPFVDSNDCNLGLDLTVDCEANHCPLQVVPSVDSNDCNLELDLTFDCEANHCPLQVVPSVDNVDLDMTVDYETNDLTLEVTNVAAYMGGYLLRKCGFHRLDRCKKCLQQFTTTANTSEKHTLISSKTFQETGCLIYPSDEFCAFVETLENLFIIHVDTLLYTTSGIIDKLYRLGVSQSKLTTCCNNKCMNLTRYMIKLYMTVRVHYKIKTLNQEHLLTHALKRNRKAKKIVHQ